MADYTITDTLWETTFPEYSSIVWVSDHWEGHTYGLQPVGGATVKFDRSSTGNKLEFTLELDQPLYGTTQSCYLYFDIVGGGHILIESSGAMPVALFSAGTFAFSILFSSAGGETNEMFPGGAIQTVFPDSENLQYISALYFSFGSRDAVPNPRTWKLSNAVLTLNGEGGVTAPRPPHQAPFVPYLTENNWRQSHGLNEASTWSSAGWHWNGNTNGNDGSGIALEVAMPLPELDGVASFEFRCYVTIEPYEMSEWEYLLFIVYACPDATTEEQLEQEGSFEQDQWIYQGVASDTIKAMISSGGTYELVIPLIDGGEVTLGGVATELITEGTYRASFTVYFVDMLFGYYANYTLSENAPNLLYWTPLRLTSET